MVLESLRARLTGAAVLLVLVAACGALPGSGAPPAVSPPTAALAAWQSFPADRVPRPIVLLARGFSPSVHGFPGGGKIAAICNKFALGGQLPTEVPAQALATWPDGTNVTYLAISATDAYNAMSNAPTAQTGCDSVAPLVVTGARFADSTVETDRGSAQMSSWLFTATGVDGELSYPALPSSAFWDNKGSGSGSGATVSRDGLMLTIGFYGAPAGNGPCDANYSAVVAESTSAVAVAMQEIPGQQQSGQFICPLVAQLRTVPVTLARPLGGRVVVDASGNPMPVCPASGQGAPPRGVPLWSPGPAC
jgi:hypothetical protein